MPLNDKLNLGEGNSLVTQTSIKDGSGCLASNIGTATHSNSKILISFFQKTSTLVLTRDGDSCVTHPSPCSLLPGAGGWYRGTLANKTPHCRNLSRLYRHCAPNQRIWMENLGRDKSSRIPQYSPLLPRSLTSNLWGLYRRSCSTLFSGHDSSR